MPTVHARTVRRAAEIVGGVQLLAAALDARDANLKKWLGGEVPVPEDIFLKCVDIVNAEQLDQISLRRTRPRKTQLSRPPADPSYLSHQRWGLLVLLLALRHYVERGYEDLVRHSSFAFQVSLHMRHGH